MAADRTVASECAAVGELARRDRATRCCQLAPGVTLHRRVLSTAGRSTRDPLSVSARLALSPCPAPVTAVRLSAREGVLIWCKCWVWTTTVLLRSVVAASPPETRVCATHRWCDSPTTRATHQRLSVDRANGFEAACASHSAPRPAYDMPGPRPWRAAEEVQSMRDDGTKKCLCRANINVFLPQTHRSAE